MSFQSVPPPRAPGSLVLRTDDGSDPAATIRQGCTAIIVSAGVGVYYWPDDAGGDGPYLAPWHQVMEVSW